MIVLTAFTRASAYLLALVHVTAFVNVTLSPWRKMGVWSFGLVRENA